MGYDPTSQSEVVQNDFGPAFEVEYNTMSGEPITLWYRKSDWGDDETVGTALSAEQARELARTLEEYAQHAEPRSHA